MKNKEPLSNVQVIDFCRALAPLLLENDLSSAIKIAGKDLTEDDLQRLDVMLYGLASAQGQEPWSCDQPLPRPAFEILRGSYMKSGHFGISVPAVAAYYENREKFISGKTEPRVFFIQSLHIFLESGINILLTFDLIAQDHPDENFKMIAKDLLEAVNTGQSLSPKLAEYSDHLGDDFAKAWNQGEQHGDLVSELKKLL